MMTNDEIIKIAMNQCAKDMMCEPEAFFVGRCFAHSDDGL